MVARIVSVPLRNTRVPLACEIEQTQWIGRTISPWLLARCACHLQSNGHVIDDVMSYRIRKRGGVQFQVIREGDFAYFR
jgi:hypothetical protein